ncbi:YjdF family protein [Gordonibacter massiliensis (ex Traore et al. 2017)]|uniref:YjdF family protein n=1 Tax=Gordonibacter massiliensis (ex Traore et al. 2017) TaxID=1841863 RepID=UPI001C8B3F5F|nr:YjdF family protein [Gordonibacter massiliensis (ex Traore et al. 2017)]MBX9034300.1 YjdF family protein [Gordonibacter massiliensis (ex Traore et al. 2017)]
MQVNTSSTLTVLHDGQFWVGICEQRDGSRYGACRFVFGPEPKDEEVLAFVCRHWDRLDFRMRDEGDAAENGSASVGARNPKRAQREARKTLEAARRGVGTKAQQALSAAYEERKDERRSNARELREAEERRAFELRTLKRKRKHRGH